MFLNQKTGFVFKKEATDFVKSHDYVALVSLLFSPDTSLNHATEVNKLVTGLKFFRKNVGKNSGRASKKHATRT